MMIGQEEETYFCYLTIYDDTEFIVFIIIVSLSLPIAALGIRNFYQLRGSYNKSTCFVYSLLLLWLLSFLSSGLYSILLYKAYSSHPQDFSNQSMSDLSQYQELLDWINAYCVQTLMLYVPYRWCKNINMLFNGTTEVDRDGNSRSSELLANKLYTGVETKLQPFLLVYIKFRVLYIGLMAAFLITDKLFFFKALFVTLLLDSLIVIVSLVMGMCSLKLSKEIQQTLDEEQLRRTFNQYLIMALATLIRTGFSIFFTLGAVIHDRFSTPNCPSTEQQHQSSFFSVAFTIAICLFGNFFPVFIILRIYTLEERPQQMGKSLLITAEALNQNNNHSSLLAS